MNSIIQQITDWLKGILVSGIMDNLTNTFSSVNDQVGQIATEVGKTPSNFMPAVFNMVRNLSESVIMPVAGILLTFIACYELIQLIISYNNLASFETWFIWKWIFKTFVAVELITHTFDITMAVFDVSQSVVWQAGGIIQGSTAIDASTLATMQSTLEAMELGPLFAIFLQSFIVQFLMYVLSAVIFVIINGRMVEIYLMVSLAPLPFATFGNREQSMMGQNYMRSLFALGFQGFLIMVCVGIYAVLIQSVAFSTDIIASLWKVMGFTILLAFTLFKTGAVAHSIFHNGLFSFTRQKKIDHATNVTREIAEEAYRLFKENYDWQKPIRSVGVRGADLVNDNYWEQIDLFSSVEFREKQMKVDEAVDIIRKRFGFYSVQRGLMYFDRALSAVDAKAEHTVHPHGYFG